MSQLENEPLISGEKALKGAKIGALVGAVLTAVPLVVAATFDENSRQAAITQPVETARNMLTVTSVIAGEFAVVGAIINGLRPTSRFLSHFIDLEVEIWKAFKNDLAKVRGIDYSRFAYDILRPQVHPSHLEHKARSFRRSAILGAAGGAGMWFLSGVTVGLDKLTNTHYPTPILPAIFEHPMETVAAGALVGMGMAAYVLIFHRPIQELTDTP